MNALLIITIVMLQSDGSITRSREMTVQPSSEACRAAGERRLGEFSKEEVHLRRLISAQCLEMATLEVIKPAPEKKPAPPKLTPDRRG